MFSSTLAKTQEMRLYPNQESHFKNLCETLNSHKMACDTSLTGAGKTIVAVKIAKHFNLPICVIAPPTLRDQWTKTCAEEEVPLTFVSVSALNTINLDRECLMVSDECHVFKNASQRTRSFVQLLRNRFVKFVLLLSATPLDHPRQEPIFQTLINAVCPSTTLDTICCRMSLAHSAKLFCELYHIFQTKEELKLYQAGRYSIYSFAREEHLRNGAIFMSGLVKIHDSLFEGLKRYLAQGATNKTIVCLKFDHHFRALKAIYPNALILNGSTPMSQRASIIAKFQRPSTEFTLLLISAAVGGVGVDLDDTDGQWPRQVICMPLFAYEFVQLLGRVQRRNTRSNSKIVVIQPATVLTYFRTQMKIKGRILEKFFIENVNTDKFKRNWEHEEDCSSVFVRKNYQGAQYGIIAEYACSCKFAEKLSKLNGITG